MVMRDDDFVRDILRRVAEAAEGAISNSLLDKIEAAARRDWGGERTYIAHDVESQRQARNQAIQAAWDRGERDLPRLARRFNVSVKTIRRALD